MSEKDYKFFITIFFLLGFSCLLALIIGLIFKNLNQVSTIIFATASGVGIVAALTFLIIFLKKR